MLQGQMYKLDNINIKKNEKNISIKDMKSYSTEINNLIEEGNISYEGLFKACNFTSKELEIANELWQPLFHQTFIEITDEKLIKWLGYKKDGFIFTKFIKELYKKYNENVHFRILNYNNEVKIFVFGLIWRAMIINSKSEYALSTLKVHNKIDKITNEIFNIIEERNLTEEFEKSKNITI